LSRRPLLGVKDRFWGKVEKGHPVACWPWFRAKNANGYGLFRIAGSTRLAHRIAWKLEHGEISDGLLVLHRCDNPACVNPAHLRLGTQSDNMAECHARGRSRIPAFRGETHPQAKLDHEKAAEIRTLYKGGGYSHLGLAKLFQVSETTIREILVGERW
jgi:hypothetical protein